MVLRLCLALLLLPACGQVVASEWGYHGAVGPDHWAELSEDYALCARGRLQSPIDLSDARPVTRGVIEREFGASILNMGARAHVLDLIDNGHTIQVTSDATVTMTVDAEDYELVQFHFHGPSEHTIDGERAALEAHFVMTDGQGTLAVLGVLYEAGQTDPAFDAILGALPAEAGDERHVDGIDLDLASLKPLPDRFYRYVGSLTTPPCTEGVRWIVMAQLQTLSVGQLEAIVSHLHDNARPTQPLNGRELLLVSP